MAERRRTCWQCGTYDREARRCRMGKTNPRKKHEAQTVAELLGPQSLCLHNPFREPLILRMRAPHRRFLWTEEPVQPPEPLEIEIIEEEPEPASASEGE